MGAHEMHEYAERSGHALNDSARYDPSAGNAQMARLGKKSVLRRNFGFLSMLSLSCTVMSTWEGIVLLFAFGFTNGGYAGSFAAFWLVWFGTLCSTATMAELLSMAPTAGGQYHWVAMLAPKQQKRFLSYIAGWLTVIAWQASVASGAFLGATLLQGIASMAHPEYVPAQWQIPVIYWAVIIFSVFFNTIASKALPQVESLILIVHVLGFVATLVPLVIWGPKGDPSVIFTTWLNGGNWPTQGLSFCVGLLGPAFAFLGADSAVHMSEEINNPAVHVPRAMVYGVLMNGCMGLGILITFLYVLGDPTQTVFSTEVGFPFMAIYQNAVGNTAGAVTMTAIVIVITLSATITFVATSSRITWAFARDKGLPGWRHLSKIEPRTNLPMWSIVLTIVISFILSMIAFGSSAAFNVLVSLVVGSFYLTYLFGNTLLFWRRISGHIQPYDPDDFELSNTMGTDRLTWGPWRVPEPLGTIVNGIGILFIVVVFFFSFFPVTISPDVTTMNWSCLILGVALLFSMAYYVVGRKSYNGPIVEVTIDELDSFDKPLKA